MALAVGFLFDCISKNIEAELILSTTRDQVYLQICSVCSIYSWIFLKLSNGHMWFIIFSAFVCTWKFQYKELNEITKMGELPVSPSVFIVSKNGCFQGLFLPFIHIHTSVLCSTCKVFSLAIFLLFDPDFMFLVSLSCGLVAG